MNEELEEQASLYVFGILDGQEATAFERRLQSDPELRELVDQLDAAAAAIAHDAPPRVLPPELRARVLARAGRSKVVAFSRKSVWFPWAIAACLAVACCYLVAERIGLKDRVSDLEKRDILPQVQIASLSSKLDSAPNANAVVVWDEKKQRGVLKVTQLPRNEKDRDYQIWMVDPKYKNPVGAGTFHVSNKGPMTVPFEPNAPVREVKGFAISLERKGGVTKAKGPIVLLGK
ncbi:MAG TPA: anti-sigma factor [Chthoniobacterales bacterium]